MRYLVLIVACLIFLGILLPLEGFAVEKTFIHFDLLWKTDSEEPPLFHSISKIVQNSNGEFLVLD